ncbi:MAG: hypothetical protein KAJ86_04945, partial [Alphaproteobacteria bacterium]|nr:hypothetical protein [Alphaproteobacteria bacterium]
MVAPPPKGFNPSDLMKLLKGTGNLTKTAKTSLKTFAKKYGEEFQEILKSPDATINDFDALIKKIKTSKINDDSKKFLTSKNFTRSLKDAISGEHFTRDLKAIKQPTVKNINKLLKQHKIDANSAQGKLAEIFKENIKNKATKLKAAKLKANKPASEKTFEDLAKERIDADNF